MVFDITKLKEIRKKLDITQKKFANIAKVSQSLIAKIESKRIDPSYSNVLKIEEAINSLAKEKEASAKDIMVKKIIAVNKDEKAQNIIKIMNKYEISQVPILDRGVAVGLVTESSILGKDIKEIKYSTAKELMIEAPPIIAENTKMSAVSSLLKFYPIVLVKRERKIIGLITKSDLLKSLI